MVFSQFFGKRALVRNRSTVHDTSEVLSCRVPGRRLCLIADRVDDGSAPPLFLHDSASRCGRVGVRSVADSRPHLPLLVRRFLCEESVLIVPSRKNVGL